MTNKIKVSIAVLTSMAMLIIGVLVGSEFTKVKTTEFTTEKVVVVNLDEGTTYDGVGRNFAVELLNNIDGEYTLTGLSDAQKGLDEGRYAAYIILPSTFSESFASINTTQNPIQLSYEIGGNITDKAKENTIVNVADFENKMSKNISNVYISSILGSYHTGQDGAIKVLDNDKTDSEKIMAINSRDLVESVRITEVDRIQNTIDALNVEKQNQYGETIIGSVDESYKKFMGLSQSELNEIKSDYSAFDTEMESLDTGIKSIPTIRRGDGSAGYNTTNTDAYLNKFNTHTVNAINTHNGTLNAFNASYSLLQGDSTSVNQNMLVIEGAEMRLQMKMSNYFINTAGATVEGLKTKINADTEALSDIEAILLYRNETEITFDKYLETVKGSKMVGIVNSYVTNNSKANSTIAGLQNLSTLPSPLTYEEEGVLELTGREHLVVLPTTAKMNEAVAADLSQLNTDQQAMISNLTTTYTSQKAASTSILQSVNAYNPNDHIDAKEVDAHVRNYKSNNDDLFRTVEAKTREFSEYASNVYDNSNKHIDSLKTDVTQANETSNKLVEAGLTDLKTVKTANSKANSEHLNSFINTLTYTRNDSMLNTKAVKFIARPINGSGTINGAANVAGFDLFIPLMIGMAVLGIAILGLGSKLAFDKVKAKG